MKVERALSLSELERSARSRLPSSIYGYVSGGSEDQSSLRANRRAFDRWRFLPRPLIDVSQRSQSVELFGTTFASPVGISPMGVSGLCCFEGDIGWHVLPRRRARRQSSVPRRLCRLSA